VQLFDTLSLVERPDGREGQGGLGESASRRVSDVKKIVSS
jgi:hypothetical protein